MSCGSEWTSCCPRILTSLSRFFSATSLRLSLGDSASGENALQANGDSNRARPDPDDDDNEPAPGHTDDEALESLVL